MKITYVTVDTELWGGICTIFQQLELVSEMGHEAFLTTPASRPDWYPLKVPIHHMQSLEPSFIPDADIIVATSWMTVKPIVESKKGIPVHLCQGYEGANRELLSMKAAVDEAYAYKIPKLTVSPHLNKFLAERFNAETYYIGHMLNRDIFYPLKRHHNVNSPASFEVLRKIIYPLKSYQRLKPLKILVVGPFEADVKNISTALKGISLAEKRYKVAVRIIRVSQFPLTKEEEAIRKPDKYYFHVPYHNMGEIYRNADVFISMSKEAEGFGLPALEAMACGVPAILSRISSYTSFDETLDYALFVEPSNPEALTEAIFKLSHNKLLREKLIQRGSIVAEKFTKEGVVNRLKTAFETIKYRDKLSKTKKAWNDYHASNIPGLKKCWWDSSVIMEHCQKLVTGDSKMNIYQFLKKEFIRNPLERGLSICSGEGEFERGVLDNNICGSADVYEIAEERVRAGIQAAKEKNYAINFNIEDVNMATFKNNHYDVFFSWSALHHVENLEGVCENVKNALKDGGLVVAQEFVGPNQFQWTDKQIEITNKILSILPERLKIRPKTGEIITCIERPTIEQMNSTDPSEAIRSRDIIPVLKRFFKIKAIKYFGGSIYNLLFNEIIGNFNHDDERDVALLKMILLMEQILIEEKILDDDYAVIIAEKL